MSDIREWLTGEALQRFEGGGALRGRPLVEAIAADLARVGLGAEQITDALVERCRALQIRLAKDGPYPSRDALTALAKAAHRAERGRSKQATVDRDTKREVERTDRQRAVADHEKRQEAAAHARATGMDPRNIESERLDQQERRARQRHVTTTGGAQSLNRNDW